MQQGRKELYLKLHDAYERATNKGLFEAVLNQYRHPQS